MDPLIAQQYNDLFTMYATPGWKYIQRQLAQMLKEYDSVRGMTTEADLNFRKGQLDILAFMIAHQDQHERAYAELLADQTGEEAEAPTGGKASVVDDLNATPEFE